MRKVKAMSRRSKNRSIAQKIKQSILTVALSCSIIIGVIGIICIAVINAQSQQLYSQNLVPLEPSYKTQTDFQSVRSDIKSMALEAITHTYSGQNYSTEIDSLLSDMDKQLNSYAAGISSDTERSNYNTILSDIKSYKNAVNSMESSIKSKDFKETMNLLNKNTSLATDLKAKIANTFAINVNQAAQRNQTSIVVFIIAVVAVMAFAAAFILAAIKLSKRVADGISAPIRKMVSAAEAISEGHLDVDLNIDSTDETGILADSLRKIVDSLTLLKTDVHMLIGEALDGRLDTRVDTSKHKGDYKAIIDGVNRMFDAIKEPLDVASDFINRLADGEHQDNIENTYKGYYAALIDNLNRVRSSVEILEVEAAKLADAGRNGKLDVRGDETKLKGTFAKIIHGVNDTFDAIKKPLDAASVFISNLAAGTADAPVENTYKGYYAALIDNLNSVFSSLNILNREAAMLAEAGAKGDLSVRSDISKVSGHYADIIGGMNGILDAVSAPLNEAGHILKNISDDNDFSEKMAGQYNGAFDELSESINQVIERLNAVEKLFVKVSNGDLSMLEVYKKVGQRSEKDKLLPASVRMMQAISDLISEANRLAAAATEGNLSQRGEEEKFSGGYREVINGINRTVIAVVSPIEEASVALQGLSQSDLTIEMKGSYKGEYNKIKIAITRVVDSFNEVLSKLNIAADQVAVGAKQVSDASQSLSQGAAEQASSVEELTSSITEVAAQTKQNATNATQASELSSSVQDEAEQGNTKMKQMLDSMKEIDESSTNISKIIKVIDDIAFQTNILALNAAVEAARAGQYGKGFAVVAEEVRNLAAKSAEAAKKTTALIEGSISKVESGTRIANETAETLGKISESINKSTGLIKNIAASSNEQATAISQIDQGITQVSSVVQTNSATAEESAASSEELSGQAEALMQMVSGFKLKD